MGGEFQSPLEEGADIISANSHKTFPGPHKAIVAFNDEALGKQVEATILKNFVSSTQTNVLLSLIVTIFEMQEFGSAYAKAIILNANTLGKTLEECGLHVRHADADTYTHTHQLHVFTPFNREETVRRFLTNNISLGTSGALGTKLFIRLGVQEITRRGYDEADVVKLGKLMADVFKGKNAQKGIAGLLAAHPSVKYGYEL
jgi:glycine/serine hydroxymethyltransferase